MALPSNRIHQDTKKLMMKDYKVDTTDDVHMFCVTFHGPTDSLYEGGVWKIKVELPQYYPYKSPSVEFVNTIYHPNVDEYSGSVCLDVINQNWSPMFDLVNVFDSFLPQLLLYPNPEDPFNEEAASLMMQDPAAYEERVKEYCRTYAKPEDINDDDDDSMSEHGPEDSDNNEHGPDHCCSLHRGETTNL